MIKIIWPVTDVKKTGKITKARLARPLEVRDGWGRKYAYHSTHAVDDRARSEAAERAAEDLAKNGEEVIIVDDNRGIFAFIFSRR